MTKTDSHCFRQIIAETVAFSARLLAMGQAECYNISENVIWSWFFEADGNL